MAEPLKLAAILAADVVGYSRLMGEDEAGTATAENLAAGWSRRPAMACYWSFKSVAAAVECACPGSTT
jgi:hypothetical protein